MIQAQPAKSQIHQKGVPKLVLSKHAVIRKQQRGIQPAAISFIVNYGKSIRTNNGCIKKHFDKGCLRKIKNDKIAKNLYRQNDQQINSLILIINPSCETLVTVMHSDKSQKLRWN